MRFYCHPIVRSFLVIIQWCRSQLVTIRGRELNKSNCQNSIAVTIQQSKPIPTKKRKDKKIETMIIDFDCHLMVEIDFRFPTNNNKLMLQGIVTKKSLSLTSLSLQKQKFILRSNYNNNQRTYLQNDKEKLDFNCVKIYLCDNNN